MLPIKGPDVFFEAAAGLARRRPSVGFVMVGEGPMRAELAERAAEMGLEERIVLPGHVQSLTEVLRRSAVFVCSSRSEGFPTVVLEAMAAGVPVVASNVGGVPELVADGVNGLLFDSEDHEQLATLIEGLLTDRGAARTFAARAREKVQTEFRFEDTMEQTERLYLRLLDKERHETA
jgi:glycosyltransferase involved in cell wall biosynthesis